MCFNEHYNFYNNLIIEEKKHIEKRIMQKLKKTCEKRRGNKRKEEEETSFINNYLFVNVHYSFCKTSIREERNNVDKETK